MEKTEDEYLNFISFYYGVKWSKEKIFFPFEVGDNSVIIENQRSARISFRELSQEYKEALLVLSNDIAKDLAQNGATEDELVRAVNFKKSLPYHQVIGKTL